MNFMEEDLLRGATPTVEIERWSSILDKQSFFSGDLGPRAQEKTRATFLIGRLF